MVDNLQKCPFCGSVPRLYEDDRFQYKPADFPKYYLKCLGCGIRTRTDTKENVIRSWQTRAKGE